MKSLLEFCFKDHENDVALIPIPQYPLYSAAIAKVPGNYVGYEMTENYDTDGAWGLDLGKLEKTIVELGNAKKNVKCLAVINPGNPTGNVGFRIRLFL